MGAHLNRSQIETAANYNPGYGIAGRVGGNYKIDHRGKSVTAFGLSGGAPGGRSYLLVLIEPRISVAITGNIDGPNLEATARDMASAF